MTIAAVVFSRDRAAQLDLLLTSLEENAAGVFAPVHVLWTATEERYERAYETCRREHPLVVFVRESAFRQQVDELLAGDLPITFFTDDSVFFAPLGERRRTPEEVLERDDVLCFTFRLGRNTLRCYPFDRKQRMPRFRRLGRDVISWKWRGADADFGYPGSVDGHVFRPADLVGLLSGADFSNPNSLESELSYRVDASHRERMAAYKTSHLVGIPANRVNETTPNRYGERWPSAVDGLNDRYLTGERLRVGSMSFEEVDGAHAELPLVFASKVVA